MAGTGFDESPQKRRNDCTKVALPIKIIGTDLAGQDFFDSANTQEISRYGASVLVPRALAPEQVVLIRVGQREAKFRIIGQIGRKAGRNIYGVSFLEQETGNFWGVAFPQPAHAENSVVQMCLECHGCESREIVELNELELQVFKNTSRLLRQCQRCRDMTYWGVAVHEAPQARAFRTAVVESPAEPEPAAAPAPTPSTDDRRRQRRVKMAVRACIRLAGREEVVQVVDMSRSGFRFRGRRKYAIYSFVEVAIPYIKDTANIFLEGRVMWWREVDGFQQHGIKYLKT